MADQNTESPEFTGKVKFFKDGWGFILPDSGEAEIFVHYTGIEDDGNGGRRKSLEENQLVSYKIGSNKKGICAVNVIVQK